MFKKIILHIKKIFVFTFNFNPLIAVQLVIFPVIWKNKPAYDLFSYQHKVIMDYLKRKYRKIIKKFTEKRNEIDPSFADNYPVWFLWWQGEELMPPVVKICYQTLLKFSNGHKVNLVTENNYKDFVNIPEYILKKVSKKNISLTHLSDILRLCLLYEHGGLWIDSTVLLSCPLAPLPKICAHLGFWTPKDDGSIITTCFKANNWIVREGRWLTFCFYSSKRNILTEFVMTMFLVYVKNKNIMIDYFLFDYFIAIAYDVIQEVRIMIDSVPENNPKVHEIYHRLNLNYEYNKELFDEICSKTFFHKLNMKDELKQYTKDGKLTNYGYIINNYPPK